MEPIILKQWEARACSEGRLTQLRRPIKWPPGYPDWTGPDAPEISFCELKGFPGTFTFWEEEYPEEGGMNYTCPYGAKGDRLKSKDGKFHWTIKDVRVERVQEISEDDARRHGFRPGSSRDNNGFAHWNAQYEFEIQWNKDYPKYQWDSNPWVCVLDLEKI